MSTSRNFNHYTDSRGGGNNNNSINKKNTLSPDPAHHLNQHSLQQRRMHQQHPSPSDSPVPLNPNLNRHFGDRDGTSILSRMNDMSNESNGSKSTPWPDSSETTKENKGRSTTQQQQQQQHHAHERERGGLPSPTRESNHSTKISTPVVTAKNARNFWRKKDEIPIKSWKKPALTSSTMPLPQAIRPSSLNHHENAVTSHSVNISTISSSINGGNDQDHVNTSRTQIAKSNDSWMSEEYDTSKRKVNQKKRREPSKLLVENFKTKDLNNTNQYYVSHDHGHRRTGSNISLGSGSEQSSKASHNTGTSSTYYHKNVIQHEPQHYRHRQNAQPEKSRTPQNKTHNNVHLDLMNSNDNTQNGSFGEMEIKLDIAAAQLLTEEMKYKDLMERHLQNQKEQDDEISKLKKLMKTAKAEEGNQVQVLENELMQSRRELVAIKEQQHQSSEMDDVIVENANMKGLVEEQKMELEELYVEIQRLHDNHRDDSDILNNKIMAMEKKNEAYISNETASQIEIANLTSHLRDMNDKMIDQQRRQNEPLPSQASNHDKFVQVQDELDSLKRDFSKLAEETERLDNELEAVTEDRDELLRRSVLYHNAANDSKNSPNSTPNVVNGKKIVSSLTESSVQGYELQRIRTALEESEDMRQKQEINIQELEKLVNSRKEMDNCDLSAIDFENSSFLSLERQGKITPAEDFNRIQKDCIKYKTKAEELHKHMQEIENEREELKQCLGAAMQDIENLEDNQNENKKEYENKMQQLLHRLDEREIEIEKLQEISRNASGDVDSSNPLREELLNMVGWLNSSNRVNGSPSIECMLTDPHAFSDDDGDSEESSEEFNNDDPALQSVYNHFKSLQKKVIVSRREIRKLKKEIKYPENTIESQPTNEMPSSSEIKNLIKDARLVRETISTVLQSQSNDKDASKKIREPLMEASKVIDNLSHELYKTQMIPKERIDSNQLKLEHGENVSGSNENFFEMIQISPFELRRKDEEIVEQKIIIAKLNEKLRDAAQISVNCDMEEMPTPTKSNRSDRKKRIESSTWRSTAQSSNEEDDMKVRMAQSELVRLQNDLKKRVKAEDTLKSIIRETSSRLTAATGQVDALAKAKCEMEKVIEDLESKARTPDTFSSQTEDESKPNVNGDSDDLIPVDVEKDEEILCLKRESKVINKDRKKLKKSLSEAVKMLNALQEHVITAEKDRKKIKRQLRAVISEGKLNQSTDSKITESKGGEALFDDRDQMENRSIILQLKSHIVALDHEIHNLTERIDELEAMNISKKNKKNNDKLNQDDKTQEITRLEQKLIESQKELDISKNMLNEVTQVNNELLADLRATEAEGAEVLEEMEVLRERLQVLKTEINHGRNAKVQNLFHE